MNPNPSLYYRQQAVRGASPIGLVVLMFEALLGSLNQAIRAVDAGEIEKRVKALNHVLSVIDQLQGSLDFEKAPEVARNLDIFYTACRKEILDASFTQTRAPLDRILPLLNDMHDAWKEADRKTRVSAAPASRPNPYGDSSQGSQGDTSWSA